MNARGALDFPVYVVTARLENGLMWTQGLFFPEVGRLAGGRSPERLLASVRKRLELMDPLELRQVVPPARVRLRRLKVRVPPYRFTLDALIYPLQLGGKASWAAHVLQFDLEVTADSRSGLRKAVVSELRSFLVRSKLLKETAQLVQLQRWREVTGEFHRVAVAERDPNQGEREEEQLPKLCSALGKGPSRAVLVDADLRRLADLLVDQNVLLVGPSGCGKTALVHELARRAGEFGLGGTPFYETSGARLLLGEVSFGGWQERCQKLVRELGKLKGVLHLGSPLELLESGRHSTNPYGVAGFLRPYLASRDLHGVAEATSEQLAVVEREFPQLLETFTVLRLEPSGAGRTLELLEQSFAEVSWSAVQAVSELHSRFASSSAAPGWPVRLLRGLLRQQPRPTRAEVMEYFSGQSGLPLLFLEDSQPFVRTQVKEWFSRRLFGQERAVDSALERLAAFKHGLTRSQRPIASFLLIGPTGVGKTELARCLAEFVYQDRGRLTRLDMSEFSTPWAVQRLIRSDSGMLVARVRERPFQVLLFDELEKAHPDFFDLLLQILGDARLSDDRGEVADFSNCLILMTSNLGADTFQKGSLGVRAQSRQSAFMEAVRATFRPELLNRIDEIIPFDPLTRESILRICRWELQCLGHRPGLQGRAIELEIGAGVDELLADQGYHPLYGARPLKRALDRLLLAPLSELLNNYPAQLALRVSIEVGDGQSLQVRAFPLGTLDQANAKRSRQQSLNQQMSQLRRRYRLVDAGKLLVGLRNERKQFQQKHPDKYWPHTQFLEAFQKLGQEIESLEELALASLSDGHALQEFPEQLAALQQRLQQDINRAFALNQPKPIDRALVGLYSWDLDSLRDLTQRYMLACEARALSCRLEAVCLRKGPTVTARSPLPAAFIEEYGAEGYFYSEQGWTRHPQIERQRLQALDPEQRVLGYILEISGTGCFPWLESETGLHRVIRKGLIFPVLVDVSKDPRMGPDADNPFLPPAYQPPADVHRKVNIKHDVQQRTWHYGDKICQDRILGPRPLAEDTLGLVLEERLTRRASAAAEGVE